MRCFSPGFNRLLPNDSGLSGGEAHDPFMDKEADLAPIETDDDYDVEINPMYPAHVLSYWLTRGGV